MFMEVWTMATEKKWQLDLGEYIRQGEPAQAEKSESWQIAIGLQQVDGLETSDYLLATAKDHIEGKIDIKEAQRRIVSYYEAADQRQYFENDTAEADIVSSRITELLGENTFQFSPAEFQNIHKRLFTGIIDHAGMWRTYNISKAEWVLNGKSVVYAPWQSIRDTLDYDFEKERVFSYGSLTLEEIIQHLASFTSGIWQIHPFCEGNTRTTAVFILKYMKAFGLSIDNEVFKNHSWYFRNALVRANYNDLQNNIHATTNFLEQFFENLLLGTDHELKNRYLHIDFDDWQQSTAVQSATDHIPKCQNGTLECTLEELALLRLLAEHPGFTQRELQEKTGRSLRTIKRTMIALQNKGYIQRTGGKRYGKRQVLVDFKKN